MRSVWNRIQTWPIWLRWPVKEFILGVVVFFVLYPSPAIFVRHVANLQQLDALPDPTLSVVRPVMIRFDAFLVEAGADATNPKTLLKAAQRFVHKEIPYGWDWEVWGVVDYVPTVAEIIAKGTEDCDGRAVLAATLLRAKGIDARLVGGNGHIWIHTPHGETMGPLGTPTFRANETGLNIRWRRLLDPGPLAFGISVFPLTREMIILLTAWLLLLPPGVRRGRAAVTLFLLVEALVILRLAGTDPRNPHYGGIVWASAHCLAAVIILWLVRHKTRKRAR